MHRLRSFLVLAALLGACGHAKAPGPKWPEPAATDDDGGESIEPRPSTSDAVAVEKSKEPDDEARPGTTGAPRALEASEERPVATPAAAPQPDDDVFMSEDITIEIDE